MTSTDYDASQQLIDYYLDFFVYQDQNRYERFTERHVERAHTLPELEAALEKAGMRVEAVYGELETRPPRPDDGRIFVVARRLARP